MKVNQWINAIFSPTGGTAKVARSIAKGSGLEVREVDLSAPVTPGGGPGAAGRAEGDGQPRRGGGGLRQPCL